MSAILKELPELVANNVISPETAAVIEQYYTARREPQGNRLLTIFGALGGILVGLGIILIFAHNWDDFSKSTKTMLSLFPLVAAQALTFYTLLKNKSMVWRSAAGALLFFAVGAAISLIAQVYNISGNLGDFLFTWILLCTPLIYILRTNVQAVLHIIFATYYAVEAGYFDPERPWGYLLFIAALMPFYIQQVKENRNEGLVAISWLLPLSGIISLGGFLDGAGEFGLLIYLAFAAIIHSIGHMAPFHNKKQGYLTLGEMSIVVVLMMASFRWVWRNVVKDPAPNTYFLMVWIVLFAVGIYLNFFRKGAPKSFEPFRTAALVFPVIYLIGTFHDYIPSVLTNLLVLALGIGVIREGAAKLDLALLNFGLVITSVLIACRFFDVNMSFVVRGLLFIAVGAGFFAANYVLIQRKKTKTSPNHEN